MLVVLATCATTVLAAATRLGAACGHARCPPRHVSPVLEAPAYSGPRAELTADTFAAALAEEYDGLVVVRFHAPWCRTCRATEPIYKKVVSQVDGVHAADVRFYEVNFKENKELCLRERVYALPTIHFYAKRIGRINRFTLGPTTAAKRLNSELTRYLGPAGAGSEGHLALLRRLQKSVGPTNPLVRFTGLVGLLQALVNADAYLVRAMSDASDGLYLTRTLEGDERRLKELRDMFDWIDMNGDGVIDSSELATVAAAVGSLAPDGLGDFYEFYSALLQQAMSSVAKYEIADEDSDAAPDASAADNTDVAVAEEAAAAVAVAADGAPASLDFASFTHTPNIHIHTHTQHSHSQARLRASTSPRSRTHNMHIHPPPTFTFTGAPASLDFASFTRLMTSKAVSEFREPDAELKPAFAALDKDGNGEVDREELLAAMQCVCRNLPFDAQRSACEADFVEQVSEAFDALDVDGSGTLDYEEFVAVLSGVASGSGVDYVREKA